VEPETYDTDTLWYPVASTFEPEIVNRAKSAALSLLETLTCPLMVDVLSSIVLKNASMLFDPSSTSSIYIFVADDKSELSNFKVPFPGSESAVFVLKV
jgi:hypothetical protein